MMGRLEVNETMGALTVVAYRNKGTYRNVWLYFYAQNLEAQQGWTSTPVERSDTHANAHNTVTQVPSCRE